MEKIDFTKLINKITNDIDQNIFFDSLKSGKNTIYKTHHKETKIFDEKWIDTLESYFPSINNIIESPKSALKRESELVLVERVRRVDSKTIKHLASNTKYIKMIDEDGSVIPTKLLTTHTDVHYATYENRFIKTLIERVFHFVRNRSEVIKENIESFQRTNLILNSEFPYNNDHVTYNLEFTVEEDLEDKTINEYNYKLLHRVENLQKLVNGFYQSPFMRDLANAKPVKSPLNRTSVILKNPDYNNAYLLWLFLDSHHVLPFDLDLEVNEKTLNQDQLNELEMLTMINYLSLIEKQKPLDTATKHAKKQLKGYKQIATHQNDLLDNPKYLEMESNIANEYYLNQFSELFNSRYIEHSKDVKMDETALRRSMRDLQGITNSIYEDYFDFNAEIDYFERLVKKGNPLDVLSETRDKANYAKIIREVKEVDYNEQIRFERRLLKDILYLDRHLKKASDQHKLITAREIKKELLNKQTIVKIKEYDKFLKNLLEEVKNNRTTLKEQRSEALKKLNALEREYRDNHQKYVDELVNKLTTDFEIELTKMRDLHEKSLATAKKRFLDKEAKQNDELKKIELDISKAHNLNLTAIDIYLSEYYQAKLKEYELKYNQEYREVMKSSDKIIVMNQRERDKKVKELLEKRGNVDAS